MTWSILYWVLWIIGAVLSWPGSGPRVLGGWSIGWVLLAIIGWHLFPIR